MQIKLRDHKTDIFNANILIVDDKKSNVLLLELILRRANYTTITSTLDSREVCELYRNNRYDLILLDLQMPEMDGFEVIKALKKIEQNEYLPVLVITAQPSHKIAALQLGAKDFIAKPFDQTEVLTRIYNMLEVRLLYKESKRHSQALEMTLQELRLAQSSLGSAVAAKEQAEQANYAKGAFLANMNHELCTPLNAISGLAELAQDGAIDPKQKRYLTQIKLSSQSLLVIINDILDFSKNESGKIEIKDQAFSIKTLLQVLTDLFAASIEYKQLELFVMIDHKVPDIIWGDEQRIRQILTKLIGNAIKFTERGKVQVTIDVIKQEQNQFAIRFLVRDTGIGIPIESLELLFQAFTQADTSLSRKFGGTGMGLAICQQLVGLMGGTIDVSSQIGEGSVAEFTLWLRGESCVKAALNRELHCSSSLLPIQAPVKNQLTDFDLHKPLLLLNDESSQLCYMLTVFKEDYLSIIDELSANIHRNELDEVKVQLQKIKIVAADIGAIKLSDLSKEFETQLENRCIEKETWDSWKTLFTGTMQSINKFSCIHHVDSQHKSVVLQDDITLLLQELDTQLIENTYIDIALLNKIHAAIDRNQLQEYQKLSDFLMHYDYPNARCILANILKNPTS
ncbi:ATP-binding protein [Methylobacter psychrophilus]|uniref:ATP-binding protein n=1 Tax=Methylobacter psychrophilus TaxID=96941 RepID=UPI0021D4EF09|nr:ATP-binding protein [Methylobacter psychrophilus]